MNEAQERALLAGIQTGIHKVASEAGFEKEALNELQLGSLIAALGGAGLGGGLGYGAGKLLGVDPSTAAMVGGGLGAGAGGLGAYYGMPEEAKLLATKPGLLADMAGQKITGLADDVKGLFSSQEPMTGMTDSQAPEYVQDMGKEQDPLSNVKTPELQGANKAKKTKAKK